MDIRDIKVETDAFGYRIRYLEEGNQHLLRAGDKTFNLVRHLLEEIESLHNNPPLPSCKGACCGGPYGLGVYDEDDSWVESE